MAKFPSLAPATRAYSFAEYPILVKESLNGTGVRFLSGDTPSGMVLSLVFTALTQADAKLIRDHYRRQGGTHVSFELPAAVWSGISDVGTLVGLSTLWRYVGPPTEEHLQIGRMTIAVQLQSVLL